MKIVLQYHLRLGDIIRLFPLARHLHGKGNQVFIECAEKYRSILGLIDYAEWKDPALPLKDKKGAKLYDVLYPLQIWPNRAHHYRNVPQPGPKFLDFLTAPYADDFKGLARGIAFTSLPPIEPILTKYNLPPDFSLACPTNFCENISGDYGLSRPIDFYIFESWLHSWVKPRGNVFYLHPLKSGMNRRFIHVDNLAELATLIRHAIDFATILSAPAVIASARFDKKPLRDHWHYVSPIDPTSRVQDDISTKEQVRWEVDLNQAVPRIVREKS